MSTGSAKRRWLIPVCLLLCALLVAGCVFTVKRLLAGRKETETAAMPASGALEIYMLDVGQGEAVLALYPEGTVLLMDCGPEQAAKSTLNTLRGLGITRIDTLLISHSHSDHTGALSYLLKRMPVGEVLLAGHAAYYASVTAVLDKKHVRYRYVTAGDALPGSASVTAELFNPPAMTGAADENDLSAVVKLTCGRTSVLFMGDASYEAESRMLALYARQRLRSDVLLVGHHGASTASSLSFLKAVSPSVACISVGADNEYGHPHESTLSRLRSVGAAVHTTAREGTLHLRLDGSSVKVIK